MLNDLVWMNLETGAVATWQMFGTHRLWDRSLATRETGAILKAVADLDADGDDDLIFQRRGDGAIIEWLLQGDELAARIVLDQVPAAGSEIVGAEDVDGDGDADLLVRNKDGAMEAWLMDRVSVSSRVAMPRTHADDVIRVASGPGPRTLRLYAQPSGRRGAVTVSTLTFDAGERFEPSAATYATRESVGAEWRIRFVGDMNLDGTPDLVWQSNSTSNVAIWLGDPTDPSRFKVASFSGTKPEGPQGRWVPMGLLRRTQSGLQFAANGPDAVARGVRQWTLARRSKGMFVIAGTNGARVEIVALLWHQMPATPTGEIALDRSAFIDRSGRAPTDDRRLVLEFFQDLEASGLLPGETGAHAATTGLEQLGLVAAIAPNGIAPGNGGAATDCTPLYQTTLALESDSILRLLSCMGTLGAIDRIARVQGPRGGVSVGPLRQGFGCAGYKQSICAVDRALQEELCCQGKDNPRIPRTGLCEDEAQPAVCSCEWRHGMLTEPGRSSSGVENARCVGSAGPYEATVRVRCSERAFFAAPSPDPCFGKVVNAYREDIQTVSIGDVLREPVTFEAGFHHEPGQSLCGGSWPRRHVAVVGQYSGNRLVLPGTAYPGVYQTSTDAYGGVASVCEGTVVCEGFVNQPAYRACRDAQKPRAPERVSCTDARGDLTPLLCGLHRRP